MGVVVFRQSQECLNGTAEASETGEAGHQGGAEIESLPLEAGSGTDGMS